MPKERTVIVDDTGGEKVQAILQKISERFSAANEKTFKLLEDFVGGGYEENLAKILVYLPKERRKSALLKLPESVQKKVSALLDSYSQKKNSDADVLSAVGTVLKNAGYYGSASANEVAGNDGAFFLDAARAKTGELFLENPLLAMNLEHYLVSMDILIELDDRSLQKWLREVETQELAKALRGSSEAVKDKVFRNMSRRAAEMLREDMEFMGPVRKSDVLESQGRLMETLKALEANGDIVISTGLVFGGALV